MMTTAASFTFNLARDTSRKDVAARRIYEEKYPPFPSKVPENLSYTLASSSIITLRKLNGKVTSWPTTIIVNDHLRARRLPSAECPARSKEIIGLSNRRLIAKIHSGEIPEIKPRIITHRIRGRQDD